MSLLQILQSQVALHALQGGRQRRRRPPRRLPKQLPPKPVERQYLDAILDLLQPLEALIRNDLVPLLASFARQAGVVQRSDVYSDDIAALFDQMRIVYERNVPQSRVLSVIDTATGRTEQFNRAQMNKQMRAVVPIDVIGATPGLETIARSFARENIKLVNSIPTRLLDELETGIIRNFRQGKRAEDAAQLVLDKLLVSENRAAVIARDQINKLNSELTQHRQLNLGIRRYIWRTSLDERVRPAHAELDGRVFDWDGPNSPPDGEHPGQAIMCRCGAEPDLAPLFEL